MSSACSSELGIAGTGQGLPFPASAGHTCISHTLTWKPLRAADAWTTRSSPLGATVAKHWNVTSLTIASSTSRHLVTTSRQILPSRPSQQHFAKLPFARGRVHSRFECWRTACRQLLIGEIEAANATLGSVSNSGVAAHVVLPTSYIHDAGTTGSLVCACASSLQHSALSPWSKRSRGEQQGSPGRMGCHSALHCYSLPQGIALQPRCKRAERYGRRPAFRATGALTCVSLPVRIISNDFGCFGII